ncbi:RNA-guided endonuclease TnpB family protein, partial [Lactobacillus sp.]|uniref:RNA-guided endonuclease InsQ/TnpB family protein n=1 Tax=Lactobacillus sp. TaxID=1591 RepID=UPI0019B900F3
HKLAKSIANSSWRIFRTMLEYKCEWYGKKLVLVDPRNTSRICSNCNYNSGEKPLEIREWTCLKCNAHHDRDINAAVNILNKAIAIMKPTGQELAMVR